MVSAFQQHGMQSPYVVNSTKATVIVFIPLGLDSSFFFYHQLYREC